MGLKCHSLVALGKPLPCTFIVQVSWKTEHRAILLGDKALSLYDSLNGKMVLKRPFVSDPWEDCPAHSLLRSPGDRASSDSPGRRICKPFSWETEFQFDMIVLVGRCS